MRHDHGHTDHSELSEIERRVRALETVLTQKGYIDPAALDVLIDTYQTKIGPRNGSNPVIEVEPPVIWLLLLAGLELLPQASNGARLLGGILGLHEQVLLLVR
jgi:hypothetical protein